VSADSFRADLFAGRVAMVCGGTSGIGAAIGSALSGLGADVSFRSDTEEAAAALFRPALPAAPLRSTFATATT
jgi:citronellol/citronellal dehydrogenase